MSAGLLGAKQCFNKERLQLAENLRSARCSPFVIFKVLTSQIRKLITPRARKNKHTLYGVWKPTIRLDAAFDEIIKVKLCDVKSV